MTPKPEPTTPEASNTEHSPKPIPKRSFLRPKPLMIVGAGLVLLAAGMIFAAVSRHNDKPAARANDSAQTTSAKCPSDTQLLTASPIKPEQISTIIPLGNFAPPGHILPTGHMYYNYLNAGTKTNFIPALTTIYAPADATITAVTLFENGTADTPYNSYRLDFQVCDQVSGYFIHLLTLNDTLKAALHEPYDRTSTSGVGGTKVDRTFTKTTTIKVKAGDVLGTAGGGPNLPYGLDFALIDLRTPAPTQANPARWKDDSHYVCSIDYFPAAISSQLYPHIGDYYGPREPGDPKCGQVYQDKPGTAQGTWFEKGVAPAGQLGPVQAHLTLGHSAFDHQRAVFAMGPDLQKLGFNINSALEFTPAATGHTNLDFSQVTPGAVYCYTLTDQYDARKTTAALVQLLDAGTLRIAKAATGTCADLPAALPAPYLDYTR
jgi:hypothetical protein